MLLHLILGPLLLLSGGVHRDSPEQALEDQAALGKHELLIVQTLRELRDPQHAPLEELALRLRPHAGDQLELLVGILASRQVPALDQEVQILSEVQRSLILMTLEQMDAGKAALYLRKLPAKVSGPAEASARVELMGSIGSREDLDAIFLLMQETWLPKPAEEAPAPSLGRAERETLRRAVSSIAQRDSGTFDHLKHRWPGLHPEIQTELVLSMGSLRNPLGFGVLEAALKEQGPLSISALAQLPKLGRHPFLNRNEDMRQAVRPYLSDSTAHISAACQALGVLGDMDSISMLIEHLGHAEEQVSQAAYWALGQLSGQSFPRDAQRWRFWHDSELIWMRTQKEATLQKLHSPDAQVAARAAQLCNQHPLVYDELEASVERLLRSRNQDSQGTGMRLAQRHGMRWALPAVIEELEHPDPALAALALEAAQALSGTDLGSDPKPWSHYLLEHAFLFRNR